MWCNFFAVSHVNLLHALPQKKFAQLDNFFLHVFAAKKKQKIHEVTIFLYTFAAKKLHDMTTFLTHVYRKKKLHDLTIFLSRVFGKEFYVATWPSCGPLLVLYPDLKLWEPPRRQGLCSHPSHLWATSDSVPRCKAMGTPQAAGVMYPPSPLVGHF